MEDGEIGEVRGIGRDQNLDHEIVKTSILTKKLDEFGEEGVRYVRRDSDMKRVTELVEKNILKVEMSSDDLRFLHEYDREIEGFGYDRDPRIDEIIASRNQRADIAKITGLKVSEISVNLKQAQNKKVRFHLGDLELVADAANDFGHIEMVRGNVSASYSVKSIVSGKLPKVVTGDLDLYRVETLKGIELPVEVRGSVKLASLIAASDVKFPKTNGHLSLTEVKVMRNVTFRDVGQWIDLRDLDFAADVKFGDAQSVILEKLTTATNVSFPEHFSGHIDLSKLSSGAGVTLPKTMEGSLWLMYARDQDVVLKMDDGIDLVVVPKHPPGFKLPDKVLEIIGASR